MTHYGDESGYTKLNVKTNTAKIQIIKIDEETSKSLAGVTFELRKKTGEIIGTYVTDNSGKIIISNLYQGEYVIKEIKTRDEYIINTTENEINLKYGETANITVKNAHKKGSIKILKVDKDDNKVTLGAVEFQLVNNKGEVVRTVSTNVDGEVLIENVNIGDYILRETKTKKEYELTVDSNVTIEWNKVTNVTVENEKKKGQIKVIKVDLDDNEIRIPNVEFEVYNEKNQKVETLITDENGEATTKRLPIDQNYTIIETRTLNNYVLNDTPQTVTLKRNEITDLIFENEKIKGYIEILKISTKDNKYSNLGKNSKLEGAVFEIYDSENKLVDTITTNKDGKAITKELLKGKYTIKEIKAPDYYLINNTIFDAEIIMDQEVVNVEVKNNNVDISVEINKNGFIETQSKDTIFYNFSNIHNTSNVPLDNFTWEDELPINAVRANRIYTGTYNQDLNYSIWYKTNVNDYKLLKDELNTKTNYEVNFKDIELQENEYITNYQFRFGTVKVGFKEEEQPILYCDMLDNLGNGFVFTNNTKVSGTYLEKYVEDTDKWTTITYFKEIELNEILPRTGK